MIEKEKTPMAVPRKTIYARGLPICHEFAAGIDIGDTFHAVAVWSKDGYEVREYGSFTEDLEMLVQWLVSEKITTAAMESTGIYWVQLYLMLEEAGIEPYLVNAKHVKNVTGRKKDDTDAIWLQKLHSCGLLQKSFQPDNDTRVLRSYVRQRKSLLQTSSDSVRRMQKALELMNIKLHTVISDILGKTGLSMVKAILDGERSAKELLKFKDHRIKASEEVILKSLNGIYKEEYLFALKQSYDEYMFYQKQVDDCDEMIRKQLEGLAAKVLDGEITETPLKKKQKRTCCASTHKPC